MRKEDKEDMRQYVVLKHLDGRRATRRQLEIDFMRVAFGKTGDVPRDAFKHKSNFEFDVADKSENRLERFLDMIEELSLAQRIMAALIFCGLTIDDIKRLTGTAHTPNIYKVLRDT